MTYSEHVLWRLYDAGVVLGVGVVALILVLIWVALTDRGRW